MLGTMTPETRAKANEARKAAVAVGKAAYPVKRDAELWALLAAERGLRLPQGWERPTGHALAGWCKRLNLPGLPENWGCRNWAHFIRLNPAWSLRDMVGLLLEDARA